MTNPDREELVKLAERLAALPTFKIATVVTVPGVACDERERDLIVTALRRLASSEDAVKGEPEPVAWRYRFVTSEQRDWSDWFIVDDAKSIPNRPLPDLEIQPLFTAPPADAGMREALELAVGILQDMIQRGQISVGVTGTNGYYIGEDVMPKIVAALTAPGATTKSAEGAPSSLPSGESEPAVTQASPSADTGDEYLAGIMETTKSDGGLSTDFKLSDLKTSPELLALIERAKKHVMTPEEIHEQRRSFAKGMCPSHRDYKEWCAQIDKRMPPLRPSDPSPTRSEVTALTDIAKERQRQREVKGWSLAHDDAHVSGELAMAGACYALASSLNTEQALNTTFTRYWPWGRKWWKPKTPRENLVRAGALIVAEIERIDRLETHEIRRK